MHYAPIWRRAIVLAIDIVVFVALFSAPIFAADSWLHLGTRGLDLRTTIFGLRQWDLRSTSIMTPIKFVVAVAYFAEFEAARFQPTPGKVLLSLRVTGLLGHRISFQRAFLRLLGRVVSGATFGLGYAIAAFTRRHQALHDMLASTVVLHAAEF